MGGGSDDGRGAAMDALKSMRSGAQRARGARGAKRGEIMIEIGLGEPEAEEGTVSEAETESGEMMAGEDVDLSGLELEEEDEESM
jgi:hypothetical protein